MMKTTKLFSILIHVKTIDFAFPPLSGLHFLFRSLSRPGSLFPIFLTSLTLCKEVTTKESHNNKSKDLRKTKQSNRLQYREFSSDGLRRHCDGSKSKKNSQEVQVKPEIFESCLALLVEDVDDVNDTNHRGHDPHDFTQRQVGAQSSFRWVGCKRVDAGLKSRQKVVLEI